MNIIDFDCFYPLNVFFFFEWMSITLAEDVAVSPILMMCFSGVDRGKKGRRIDGKLMKVCSDCNDASKHLHVHNS